MDKKNILGLDLGTNSIGWALVKGIVNDESGKSLDGIIDAGSRIIPMDAAMQGDFAKGNTVSQTKNRTEFRGNRRLLERYLLRRERLHRVLKLMNFLPSHYADSIDRYGKFKTGVECRLPWAYDKTGKPQFIFMDAYNEMLQIFRKEQPELMKNNMKVPYDWTIYYLRQKALHVAISCQELAWILLNFNQKRGYRQTRGEEPETNKKAKEEYFALKVVSVEDTGEKKGKDTWYNVHLENGMIYHRAMSVKPDWEGLVKEFIVTTQLEPDGITPKRDKNGEEKRSFRMPNKEDWALQKKKTEYDISQSHLMVGEYIFNALLQNPKKKIKGGLVRVIERDWYKEELEKILDTQQEFIPQLSDTQLYKECVMALYPQNEAYRNSIANRDFKYLLLEDILFYQRPLKSKKSLISECPYEYHEYKDEEGKTQKKYVKCISKSHPLYQEFRLWQFVANLRIYRIGKDAQGREVDNIDVTAEFLPDEESRAELFDYLNNLTGITESDLLTRYFDIKKPRGKNATLPYRWNYVQDKQYPCNTTRGEIIKRLSNAHIDSAFLCGKVEENLWHILYSISDSKELGSALHSYAERNALDESFVKAMEKFPPFDSDYGAYSAKAIKKLLPLMRMGHHWNVENIDPETTKRIEHIIDGEVDDSISERVREKASQLTDIAQYRALPLWMACYVVYGRHSEAMDAVQWRSPSDIDNYLSTFRQHSLRNPVVEQVVTETLRTVRDIWQKHGHIDEIHIEMGRDLRNPADKRKKDTERMLQNENANLRVKALLTEFLNPELGIENVRPYSPSQQELLRIYEDTALNSVDEMDDDISEILKRLSDVTKRPSSSDVKRYKLWLEQHYISPYTGQTIPLTRLFTADYEIEHIIPQSRYIDDSLSNKVICESEVNKLKDNFLGFEFIKNHHGELVTLSGGRKPVRILEVDSYCDLVERMYRHNRTKKRKLLMDDIPAEFIERQLNDSRYISKFVKSLLSNIVREDGEQEAISKNVIVCTGSVTDRLKRDWGMNEVWNSIILPRFERMNALTNTRKFTSISTSGHLIPDMPLELQKWFNKKRIDHRHHAMDAIVIACTTREHVNLLSNEAASPKSNVNRYQLSRKLRNYEEVESYTDGTKKISVAKGFKLPWASFPADVEKVLRDIIVSFKQNLRVINKSTNYSLRYVNGKKKLVPQTSGDGWAIRKSMHKATVFGEINLRRKKTAFLKDAIQKPQDIVNRDLRKKIIELLALGYNEKALKTYFNDNADIWQDVDLSKIEIYYFTKDTSDRFFATRKPIDMTFDRKTIENKIADTGIQKIMLRHLTQYGDDANLAFSPEGLETMNRNIVALNDGHYHQPIYKVRVYEKAEKFAVGQTGNKNRKFVEADKGTNLFFAIYEEEFIDKATGESVKKRSYKTIPLYVAVDRLKQGLPIDADASFILSPNDLVYLPTEEERKSGEINMPIDKDRVYKFVDSSGVMANFVPYSTASVIFSVSKEDSKGYSDIQNELGCGSPKSKNERAITGEMIKAFCIPLKVDRLGQIIKIGK